MHESILTFPKSTLCPEIWEKVVDNDGMNEIWQLKHDVKSQINAFIAEILKITKFKMPKNIHITGSITSNIYSENGDIDIHILDLELNESHEKIQKILIDAFNTIKTSKPELIYIQKHPLEIYYQANKFQDFMSIGCYDFINEKWLVGPEFIDKNFNPYKEYYDEIYKKSSNIVKYIRNVILSIYEISVILKKNFKTNFCKNIREVLIYKLKDVEQLYDNIRNIRKKYSSPTSLKQALEWRKSRKWKISDATFKLLDKFGYLAILKQFIENYKLISNSNNIDLEIVENILNTIKKYINNIEKLSEKELFEQMSFESNNLNEGRLTNIAIAALLAIPGVLPQDALAKELDRVPRSKMNINSTYVQNAIDNATVDSKMYGGFSYRNAINILQWVYYTEAANQSLDGRKAIFSIVWNRAGGDPQKLISVVLKYTTTKSGKIIYQFSEWKPGNNWGLVAPNSNADWKYKVPKDIINPRVRKIWQEAEIFAKQMLAGKWKSNIGNCNMIASDHDSLNAKNTWGKNCTLKIGDHRFGYDPYQDGYKKSKQKNKEQDQKQTKDQKEDKITRPIFHIVQAGENLWKIAKKYNTNVQNLEKLNNIDAKKIIKVGQKLRIK